MLYTLEKTLQTYSKMRGDLIDRFYGDSEGNFNGITPARVKQLTEACETSMLEWLNDHRSCKYADLKTWNPSNLTNIIEVPEEFEFDNTLELMDTAEPIFEFGEDSSDEMDWCEFQFVTFFKAVSYGVFSRV